MTFPRSAFRAITASQIFRTAPIARQPQHRQLGRRFYASGKGYKEYLSSNIPWLIGSIGLGGPMIVYLLRSRPKKKSHDERHGADHGVENEDTEKDEGHTEEQEVSGDKLVEQESKGEDTETQNAELKQSSSEIDESHAMNSPDGQNSIPVKQQNLSNADTMRPSINEPGTSIKGEDETETAKVKETVSSEQPRQ